MNHHLRLAPELMNLVGSFCEPRTLISLARVDRSWQANTEHFLYRTIHLQISFDAKRRAADKCLKTLSSNPKKCAIVEILKVDFPNADTSYVKDKRRLKRIYRLATRLVDSLRTMSKLSDLRLILPIYEDPQFPIRSELQYAIKFVICKCGLCPLCLSMPAVTCSSGCRLCTVRFI